uniref:Uncharacterized protein n=1 Tax=Moniliophthora roreri TaxID=221103 RepID=A0A0W0FZX2_MONRR
MRKTLKELEYFHRLSGR